MLTIRANAQPSPFFATQNARLTTREQTILSFIAQGLSSKRIAEETQISVRTVDAHRRNIKSKLGLESAAEMIRYAVEHGLVVK